VLYEMLTGKRPFEGEDTADTMAAVLRAEPDWSALSVDVPPPIRTLIQACLRKDRRQRIGDISTALFLLNEPLDAPAPAIQTRVVVHRALWRRAMPFAATAALVAALVGGVAWSVRPSLPPLTVTRFPFTLPEGQQFTNYQRGAIAISPDGTQMVYVANQRLYLRAMSEVEARPISGTEQSNPVNPVFSPDGRSIAFRSGADGMLKRIGISGGAAVTICQADGLFGISWGPDGILFGQGSQGIMRVSPNGGKPERLVSVNGGELAHGPQMLPDGQTVLLTLTTGGVRSPDLWDKADIIAQSLKSGARKTLIQGGSDARYLPTGHLVYALRGVLFAVPFDPRRLEVTGGAVPIVEGVRRAGGTTGTAHFSVSNSGSLIYIPGPSLTSGRQSNLALLDRKGSVTLLKLPPGPYDSPRISPDGKRVAFGTDDGKEASVWIYELSGASAMRRLTFGGNNRFPIWSADGRRVAFQSDREGDLGIFWQPADVSGAAERLTKPDQGTSHVPESWSPKDDRFSFSVVKGASASLWTFSVKDKKAAPFGDVRSSSPLNSEFSPDGRWVAYTLRTGTGAATIYVQPFPATGAKYQISKDDAGHHALWSPDGKAIFYAPGASPVVAVSVTTQPTFTFGNPAPVAGGLPNSSGQNPRNYDIAPDGQRFIFTAVDAGQTQSGAAAAPQIQVVLNWTEELKAKVPGPR
jgi:Tol biopolymer transport system component